LPITRNAWGSPGYSSHQFSVSVETEITNVDDVREESARLYDTLQQSVDEQILSRASPGKFL
jgi:hypothetical protein